MRKKILTLAVIAATLMFAACGNNTPADYGVETEMNGRFEVVVDKDDETPTATVAPTDAPVVTEEPEIVEPTVEPTVEPVPTEEPEVIEPTVEPTAAPTEAPEIIEPEPTDAPEVVEPTKAPEPTATPKPTATPVPTATPKPTEAPKPTKAPVVESKDFKTVLRELHSLDDYAAREAYVNKLDKSAYKVSTIKAKDFYSEGNLDALFTGDIANSYELAGVYYGCSIDGKYELVTVVDTATGEVDVWGVKYDASLSGETEHVRAVPELVLYAYNSIYGGEHGNILTWDSLKYYIDIFNPADYLE